MQDLECGMIRNVLSIFLLGFLAILSLVTSSHLSIKLSHIELRWTLQKGSLTRLLFTVAGGDLEVCL